MGATRQSNAAVLIGGILPDSAYGQRPVDGAKGRRARRSGQFRPRHGLGGFGG